MLGFPIRKSSDQSSVDSSPRHIAASHVLHRPLMPRHPPCALKHLQKHKNQKTIQRNHTTTSQHQTSRETLLRRGTHHDPTHASLMLATTIHESNTTPHHQAGQQQSTPHQRRDRTPPVPQPTGRRGDGPVVSGPNSVFDDLFREPTPKGISQERSVHCMICTRTPTHYR